MEGMILKIDRCSKHDGPGLRTVVFLKGCPLRCLWCSTPESQLERPQLLHLETLCVHCGRCLAVCPENALRTVGDEIIVDHKRCTLCNKCIQVCLKYAKKISGTRMTVEEIYEIISRNRAFWNRIDGGMTVSGGEIFFQFEFTKALLKKCHKNGIDTNIESSLFAPSEKVKELLPYLDHVCCDIKHMDDIAHKKLTGVSNKQIHKNIQMISHEKDLIIRYPIIPTCNDSEENIEATADFVKKLGPRFKKIELIPYHQMGIITYKRLGRNYPLEGIPVVKKEFMQYALKIMESRQVNASLS